GLLAGLRPGGTVVVHSTIGPDAAQTLAAAVESSGHALIDAPVSHRGPDRKLPVMVGGRPEVVDAAQPVLDAVGEPVVRLGGVGAGQLAKLVNNTMLAATVSLGADVLELGAQLGLDPQGLLEVLSVGSSGGTWTGLLASR